MKIKGAFTKGKDKGRPIEYSPDEKFPLAVKEAVKLEAPEGEVWWAEDIEVDKKHWAAKAPNVKKGLKDPGFANNGYSGSGRFNLRRHILSTDKLKPKEKRKFSLQFCDCKDELGMPDLKIEKFELKEAR
jgi:hypothetical protein